LIPSTISSSPAVSKRIPHPSAPRPNIILITIDTFCADHLGCYRAKNIKTPTLDALAADDVVFDRAISQVPLTWASHAAILTGTYPFQNGVQDFTGQPHVYPDEGQDSRVPKIISTALAAPSIIAVPKPCTYEPNSGQLGLPSNESRFPKLLKTTKTKMRDGLVGRTFSAPKAGALACCDTP